MKRVFAAAALAATMLLGVGVSANAEAEHVTICHRTGSASNPYIAISPSAAGVVNGHMDHEQVGNGLGGDIIPVFTYKGVEYSKNLDTVFAPGVTGADILANGCKVPGGQPAPWVATAAIQEGSPCGDPFYGFVLNSNYDSTFTIRYRGPISHGVYVWKTKVVDVQGGVTWASGTDKANFIHVKAGTVITIVATYGEDSHGFTFNAVKSGRVTCPWQ